MAVENGQPQESDLDKTDKLPILEGVLFDADVADDAVRMERPPASASLISSSPPSDFHRPSAIDLPSLAESVRSVEERIARQNAEYESLARALERSRAAESAAAARANALEKDLASTRATLEAEQLRSREMERSLAEKLGSLEATRARAEDAARESERSMAEARTLRESLAARDATIVQVLHSLGERDAQLSALQAEHAKILPRLEARANSSTQLEGELNSIRTQLSSVSAALKSSEAQSGAISAQLKRQESELNAARADLAAAKTQAVSHLELLRTRDWRSGFHQNLFRDMDARVGAADAARAALMSERDRARNELAALEAAVAEQGATIERLQGAAAAQVTSAAEQSKQLQQAEQHRIEWSAKTAAAEAEHTRLSSELAGREQMLAAAQTALAESQQRVAQLQAEHAAKAAEFEADAETREQEMTVLVAHLKEARRPIEAIEGDVKRLKEELALKVAAIEDLTEEAVELRAALERTRGQLEEREFLIRRLERSESNNANVLGRIQTSMERLGSSVATAGSAAAGAEWSPELIRIDGDRSITHALGRRTRIGRAPGCELHIDSSSVSRHHALILAGTREAIIEDLNSTNGVILNGRRVTRQVLNDGDIVTIGEIQFRYVAKPVQPAPKG
ncbi:MAG TPA: FHA domain-containing protein [Steroidobacteraceae bacterium]|jgi:chromosome segregation ATPase|nr:FHA domain-containing protein [Steroidobacteraceae bacterium]